jgi:hypothetical protein
VVWSVRQVPQGTDDIIDVAALNFTLPVLINPPAKVKRQTLIHTILNEIKKLKDNDILDWVPSDPIPNKQWVIVTFEDLKLQVSIEGEKATILSKNGSTVDDNGDLLSWETILKPYGDIRFGISNIRLRRGPDPSDFSQDIIATIDSIEPGQPNILNLTINPDTLPDATVPAISAVINPTKTAPTKNLPAAALGQRYLVVDDVPNNTYWGLNNGKVNDIIEYNGSTWIVSFDSASNSSAIVLNTTTGLLYEWRNGQWISALEGTYQHGWWRLYL